MKKWLIIILALLLIVLVLAPGGMGIIAEKRLQQIVARWPTDTPFTVKILSYKRGWFRSNMLLDLAIPTNNGTTIRHLQLNEKIIHGPVIFSPSRKAFGIGQAFAYGNLVVPANEQMNFKQYVDQTTLLTNCVFLHLVDSVSIIFHAPKLSITSPMLGNKIMIDNFSTKIKLSAHLKEINSKSTLDTLTLQNADSTFTATKLEGHGELEQDKYGLFLGNINFSVANAAMTAGNTAIFDLKNVVYSSNTTEKNDLIAGTHNAKIDYINVNNVTYGPAEFHGKIQNVNAVALAKLKKLTHAADQNNLSEMQIQHKMQQLILRTIARGMQLNINELSIQTPNGEVAAKLNLSMPDLMTDSNGKVNQKAHIAMAQLILRSAGSLEIVAPKAVISNRLQTMILANIQAMQEEVNPNTQVDMQQLTATAQQQANMQLQNWVNAGFLIQKDDNYQFTAAFQQGKLLINGKPIFNPAFGSMPGALMGGMAPSAPIPGNNGMMIPEAAPAATTTTTTTITAPTPATNNAVVPNGDIPGSNTSTVNSGATSAPVVDNTEPTASTTVPVTPANNAVVTTSTIQNNAPATSTVTTAVQGATPAATSDAPATSAAN